MSTQKDSAAEVRRKVHIDQPTSLGFLCQPILGFLQSIP
jgi:hypothetical protein